VTIGKNQIVWKIFK